ncbi:MAG: hypothetical protein OEZ33_11380 [Gammaproteobacteria bacterium]|nr:hypothetical protein [Gammaproteobacteria bacterium]MDH5778806.1 hypothetical protein [Gammaproteobacteria bacterium]
MDFQETSGANRNRTSAEDRSNQDRYFHVMGQGWYVLTREGIRGPNLTREQANQQLNELVQGKQTVRQKESWRYRPI